MRSSGDGSEEKDESWTDYIDKLFDPEFDSTLSSNVSGVVGHTVHLACRVNNLGTKTVGKQPQNSVAGKCFKTVRKQSGNQNGGETIWEPKR